MENLSIQATKNTPLVLFDYNKKQLLLKGRSYPENTFAFFEPVLKWLEEYFTESTSGSVFTFEIEYYNSSSSKILFDIFSLLENKIQNLNQLSIIWLYEPDDEIIKEAGEDFMDDFNTLNITMQVIDD